MKILITGARAPAGLELIRILANEHKIFVAESLENFISKDSRYIQKTFIVNQPRINT